MKNISKNLNSKWSLKYPLYVEKKDKRYARYSKQLKEHGFSDTETWSLDSVIAEFVLPRLKRFKEVNNGYPGGDDMTVEKWNAILDQIIFAFDWSLNHDQTKYENLSEKEEKENWLRYEVGIEHFAKWFRHLWW